MEVVDVGQLTEQFKPQFGPSWDPVRQGPAIKLPKVTVKPSLSDWKKCVVLPDIQAGFFRGRDGNLTPTHDPLLFLMQ
jgi:hypothetical protein